MRVATAPSSSSPLSIARSPSSPYPYPYPNIKLHPYVRKLLEELEIGKRKLEMEKRKSSILRIKNKGLKDELKEERTQNSRCDAHKHEMVEEYCPMCEWRENIPKNNNKEYGEGLEMAGEHLKGGWDLLHTLKPPPPLNNFRDDDLQDPATFM